MAIEIPATRIVRRETGAAKRLYADLCVLGSGISGISAALEAAELGRRVVLVDSGPQLGGQSTGAIIGTFCGLYANGPNPRLVTHGIADALLRDLKASGDAFDKVSARNTVIVMYRVTALQRWIEEAVRRAGISVVLGANLTNVRHDGRRLTAVELATRYGTLELEATGFVDASGDAALAWNAGLACRETEVPVYGTIMCTLEGADHDALNALGLQAIHKRLEETAEHYGLVRHDGFVFAPPPGAQQGGDEVLVNMTHIETPMDAIGMSRTLLNGRAQVDRLLGFLRAEFPKVFAAARVRAYGLPGIRQTRSIVGAYQLTLDDVRSEKRFADTIARCSWPVEFHDRPEGVYWEQFGDSHMHYVPLRSLVHADADNLVATGRCIDADPLALSSVRVMGPCIAMGAAAAHALDLAGSGSAHQIDVGALQNRLKANLEN
ncbi:MAG: FAD-dependent oxidoreductase [Alphaproteobacteria bacterium]|nr:FAD-dependent oxidoreductase [Alphaproteobacteria bacterium]